MDNTILYGRSIPSIADQLYSKESWTPEKKIKQAQYVYDAVLDAFPGLRRAMNSAQKTAHDLGYVETILGRRRHIPDMMLPKYEFSPMPGYINPDIDPMDPSTFTAEPEIPQRIKDALYKELTSYKYFGQVAKRIKSLSEDHHIKVTNNQFKITEASRQCMNCVDLCTEILTTAGWKKYDEVHVGDEILSYNLDTKQVEHDTVRRIFVYPGMRDTITFTSQTFSAISTLNHRWVVGNANHGPEIRTTEDIICDSAYVVRAWGNCFADNPDISDDLLKAYGYNLSLNEITYKLISTLSIRQAQILLSAVLQAEGVAFLYKGQLRLKNSVSLCIKTKAMADVIQYLCFVAGYATNQQRKLEKVDSDFATYYEVTILHNRYAHIRDANYKHSTTDGVWCVETKNHTWVARHNGNVFITGNSIIQGSAADLTKLAILRVESDPIWHELGGRVLVPVHDELIAEAPIEHWKEAGERLSQLMCEAASFLPFAIKCDVTTSYRWYGLEYPCPYPKTDDIDTVEPDEIKYIQYHLFEVGYDLPVIKGPNGEKPEGDEALGVNGVITDDYLNAISDYINRYKICKDEFIHHIEVKVHTGYAPER